MSTPTSSQPRADEFEVTLLGRGRGESCVVHLGQGRWIIVDSFKEPKTKRVTLNGQVRTRTSGLPAAAIYLDELEVSESAVEAIVITHFHGDHYEGTLELHAKYALAQLVIPNAVGKGKFAAIFSEEVGGHSLSQVGVAIQNADQRSFGASGSVGGLMRASQSSDIFEDPTHGIRVKALSPSQRAASAAAQELSALLATNPDPAKVTRRLEDDNRTSIALHVQACGQTALLCGDVINEPSEFGWTAILEHPNHAHLSSADIVKIAHHGSPGAHQDVMWSQLVSPGSPMLVAPFWPSGIPSRMDQERLTRLGSLFQTGPSGSNVTNEWTVTAKQPARTGIVQARCRPGEAWDIRYSPPAHPVS